MTIARVSCSWQNWPGAPGVSQFYGDGASMQPMVDALKTFFEAIKVYIPSPITITVPGSGDLIDETTGKINGAYGGLTVPAPIVGTGSGAYAGNAGFVCHWLTTTIAKGRRIRGRTFVVPAIATAFDTTGSLSSTALTAITNASAALVTSSGGIMQVWHRPVYAVPKTTPPTIVTPGSKATVTSSRVPDLAVSLRSRRI